MFEQQETESCRAVTRLASSDPVSQEAVSLGLAALAHQMDVSQTNRVLVVDDNGVNLLVAKRMLERLGYCVDTAEGGRHSITAASTVDYALILMDCQMPDLDGYETTRHLRALLPVSVPIVAMTADDTAEAKRKCQAAGMNDFLSKPLSLAEMRLLTKRWMAPVPVVASSVSRAASASIVG